MRGIWLVVIGLGCGGGAHGTVDAQAADAARADAVADGPAIDGPSTASITALSFLAANNPDLAGDVAAAISGTHIDATVRFGGGAVAALKATFATTGTGVEVNGVPQVSGVTSNDFTMPVGYRVLAQDGSIDYAVTVATPGLGAPTDVPTGTTTARVAVGDLDGDGKPDVVVTNESLDTISVFLNRTATGATAPTFAPKVDLGTGMTSSPLAVVLADLNGDGKLDIAVANWTSNSVSVFLNMTTSGATLSFAARTDLPSADSPVAIAAADLNGDGLPDLVAAATSVPGATVMLNRTPVGATTANFAAHVDLVAGASPESLALGDLDGDGRPDLAIACGGTDRLSVFLDRTAMGATTPVFAPKVDFATASIPSTVAMVDVDGDGRADLAVTAFSSNVISVLVNTTSPGAAAPTFAAKVDIPARPFPFGLVARDMNGDGRPDLVVTTANSGGPVSVLVNTTRSVSLPRFAPRADFAATVRSVAAADLDGDGKPDVIAATSSGFAALLAR